MTGCAETSESEVSVSQTEKTVTTEILTSTSSIKTTETAVASTTCIQSTESDESADEIQLLRDIYFNELNGSFEDTVDIMISKAEMLSERVLGEITSEEDAVEKARAVLTELGLSDVIERTESEFVEIDGEKVRYQRNNEPYSVEFFDEYDAYWVKPNSPSGITEDGRKIASPSMMPYVIMRKSDGKVLGAFV